MNDGTFSLAWTKNEPRRKQLLLDLDNAVRRLKAIESRTLALGRNKAQGAVVACAEKLLKEYTAELAELQAEAAVKAHQVESKRPYFLEA